MTKSIKKGSSSKNPIPQARTTSSGQKRDSHFARFLRDEKAQVLVIFILALGIRLLHLLQMKAHSPFYDLPAVDGALYDAMGQKIAGGDWLGTGVFFVNPLYPYFVGFIYAIFGHSYTILKLIQVVIGSANCVLVFAVGRLVFHRAVAFIAGAMAACYALFIFYDELLLSESLTVFTVLLALLMLLRIQEKPTFLRFVLAGLCVGFSTISRPTVLPMVAVIYAAYVLRKEPKFALLKRLLVFALAFICVILPVTARNYVAGKDLVLITSHLGLNFYLGNNPEADGRFTIPGFIPRTSADSPEDQQTFFTSYAEKETGRKLRPSQVSGFWLRKGLDYIKSQPGKWVQLVFRKTMLLLNEHEISDNQNYYQSKKYSSILRLPFISYGFVCPLALLGMVLCAAGWRKLLPFYLFVILYGGSLLFFFISSRYRMPMVPFLILFAACALHWLWQTLLHRDYLRGAKAALLLVLLLFLVHNNTYGGSKNPTYMDLFNVANKYKAKGLLDDAVRNYLESIRRSPDYISSHNNLALAYEERETWKEMAIREWEIVLRMGKEMQNKMYMDRAQRHLDQLREKKSEESPSSPAP